MIRALALIVLAFLTWLLWPRERWTRDSDDGFWEAGW